MPNFANYRQDVRQLVAAAIRGGEPGNLVYGWLEREGWGAFRSKQRGKLYLLAVGKAAVPMSRAALAWLGERVEAGVVVSKGGRPLGLPASIHYFQAGHPLPNEESLRAGIAIAHLLKQTTKNDSVLCLISGGASALLSQPRLPLAQWQELNLALLRAGCTINDVNQVRQWFDEVKGGGLAQWAMPAQVVSLILSDVIGNELAHIGSGLTVQINKDVAIVQAILERYAIFAHLLPETERQIRQLLAQPEATKFVQWEWVENHLIGDVALAAQTVAQEAVVLGFQPVILTTHLVGEAREVGKVVAALVKGANTGTALILGGETTVTVTGNGLGGRNQELALAAALILHGWEKRVIASFATDGEDGVTPVAGAIITGQTVEQAKQQQLDAHLYLAGNDSYNFFRQLPESLLTHAQSTNVNDLVIGLVYE